MLTRSGQWILHNYLREIILKYRVSATFCQELYSPMLFDRRFHITRNGVSINLESSSPTCRDEYTLGEAESELKFLLECWQLLSFEKQQSKWKRAEGFKQGCITTTLVRRPRHTKITQKQKWGCGDTCYWTTDKMLKALLRHRYFDVSK